MLPGSIPRHCTVATHSPFTPAKLPESLGPHHRLVQNRCHTPCPGARCAAGTHQSIISKGDQGHEGQSGAAKQGKHPFKHLCRSKCCSYNQKRCISLQSRETGWAAPSQGMLQVLKVGWLEGNTEKDCEKEIHGGLLNTVTHRSPWARAAYQPPLLTSTSCCSEDASFTVNPEEQQKQTCLS